MTGQNWHVFFFDGQDSSRPPVRSAWIQAEKEEEAIRIARASMKQGQRVELVRPRWEGGHAPILVSAAEAKDPRSGKLSS